VKREVTVKIRKGESAAVTGAAAIEKTSIIGDEGGGVVGMDAGPGGGGDGILVGPKDENSD
jgi:hypothetical protein